MKKTKLITNDIVELVSSACANDPKITKYKLDNYNKFMIGSFIVTLIKGQQPVLSLKDNSDGEYFKVWRNDVGGVLVKELKKEDPDLYELKTNTFKALLKLISEGEYLEFKNKGFDHINIGDNNYTIIKAVSNKKSYGDRSDDYIFENEDDDENKSSEINDENIVIDEPISANSYALF